MRRIVSRERFSSVTVDISHVYDRFGDGWPARIDCDSGWYQLICDLDKELVDIDPNYMIVQIKEKFGLLRFYYHTETKRGRLMDSIVSQYEKMSGSICEISGEPGVLMSKNGYYRTLSMRHAPEGYAPCHLSRGPSLVANRRPKLEES